MNYQGRSSFDIEQLKKDTQAIGDAITTEEIGLIHVEVPSKQTMYYFTKPMHPCHPSVVIRAVVTKGQSIKIKTKGYTNGNQRLFEKWLKQFGQQDQQIRQSFT